MRTPRNGHRLRFFLGIWMGIGGLGEMSHGLFPLTWTPLVVGTGLLVLGSVLSLGVLVPLRKGAPKSQGS